MIYCLLSIFNFICFYFYLFLLSGTDLKDDLNNYVNSMKEFEKEMENSNSDKNESDFYSHTMEMDQNFVIVNFFYFFYFFIFRFYVKLYMLGLVRFYWTLNLFGLLIQN